MVKLLLNQYPWNIKINNVKEFEQKCIAIFDYIINSKNFDITDIYTTAKYFGFDFRSKSLPKYPGNSKFYKDFNYLCFRDKITEKDIEKFTTGSAVFDKQVEFAQYIRTFTEKKVYSLIEEYKKKNNNVTKISNKIVGRIIRNNFPDTYYLMPIAFNFGNFKLQK